MSDLNWLMQRAVEAAATGISQGQTPFGCAIARDGVLIAACHNTVLATTDITAHAEVNALRTACRKEGNIFLEGATVASTCEPCPMCMAALHWARVEKVCFGASIADAEAAGFNELPLAAADVVRLGKSSVQLQGGVMTEDCRQLFDQWRQLMNQTAY